MGLVGSTQNGNREESNNLTSIGMILFILTNLIAVYRFYTKFDTKRQFWQPVMRMRPCYEDEDQSIHYSRKEKILKILAVVFKYILMITKMKLLMITKIKLLMKSEKFM